jgi:hypothetical protein
MVESIGFPRWKQSHVFIRSSTNEPHLGQCISLLHNPPRGDELSVFCWVGVHHPQAQKLLDRVSGKPLRYPLDIVGMNLRRCVPGEPLVGFAQAGGVYRVPRGHCPEGFLSQLKLEILEHGVPFMDALMTEEALLEALGHRREYAKRWREMKPLLLYCMGRPAEAISAAQESIADLKGTHPDSPAWGYYKRMLAEFGG